MLLKKKIAYKASFSVAFSYKVSYKVLVSYVVLPRLPLQLHACLPSQLRGPHPPTSELVRHVLFSEFLYLDFYLVCLCFVNEEVRAFCSQLHKTKLSPVCVPGSLGVFIDGRRVGRVPPLSWKDWGRAFFFFPAAWEVSHGLASPEGGQRETAHL